MRRLMLDGPRSLRWEDCPEPVIEQPWQALIRPVALATCDLDPAVLRGAFPLPGPFPFGHEGVAEVVAVGEEVRTVAVGDRVVVPFQISCGTCVPCVQGRTGNCANHPMMSSYGLGPMGGLEWGGLWADLARVPYADAMLVPLPQGIDPVAVASASDNIPDAFRAVGPQLAAAPGAEVLILGGPAASSIGLYAAGLAVALRASRTVYLDTDPERLAIAVGARRRTGGAGHRGLHRGIAQRSTTARAPPARRGHPRTAGGRGTRHSRSRSTPDEPKKQGHQHERKRVMTPTLELQDTIAVLNLGTDENRFSPDWLDTVDGLLDAALTQAQALVTVASGKFYSNGLDLDWLMAHADRADWYVARVQALLSRLLTFGLPTVAAINGHAFGAGAMLAVAHDYRVMRSDRGYLCFPEVDINIPFTPGMASLIQSKVAPQTAVTAMTTGHRYGAEAAVAAGLADRAATEHEVLSAAVDLARPLVGKDSGTLGAIKATMFSATAAALAA